jgi:hypothetical protein
MHSLAGVNDVQAIQKGVCNIINAMVACGGARAPPSSLTRPHILFEIAPILVGTRPLAT